MLGFFIGFIVGCVCVGYLLPKAWRWFIGV